MCVSLLAILQLVTVLSRDGSFRILKDLPNLDGTAIALMVLFAASAPLGFGLLIRTFYDVAYEKGYFLLYLVRSDRGAEVLRRLPELRKELASRGVLLSLQRDVSSEVLLLWLASDFCAGQRTP
jgi:hypothetical protein